MSGSRARRTADAPAGRNGGKAPSGRNGKAAPEVVALELEVHELRAELDAMQRAARLKEESFSIMAHELSAPLAGMKAYVETLIENYGDPSFGEGVEFLGVLGREIGRLARVVERTLEITRLSRGGTHLRLEPVRLDDLVAEVRVALQPALAARRTVLEAQIDAGVPVVAADPDLLKQVLLNLVQNAVKFSPPGHPVRVRAVPKGDGVCVEVTDEGYGIAPHDLEQVFEPWFRSADERVARERGTGLGLTIVKTIVEQHGSRIEVDSSLDHGTTFRFGLQRY